MNTPILFLVFNRPDTTKRVFQKIRETRPPRLYVAADGPRKGHSNEIEKCEKVRQIATNVDWNCEVYTLFRNKNLGCKMAVSKGIDWFFENEEMGIVLEDDCLPNDSFFRFCEVLLDKYKDEKQVMTISGNNFQPKRRTKNSYYFSKYMHCWGWAAWRRSWKHFDLEMKDWPELKKENFLSKLLNSKRSEDYWSNIFDLVYENEIDSWAYIWQYSIWRENGVNILPEVNLVSNIGFGKEGTHTTSNISKSANMSTYSLKFPLKHPKNVDIHQKADKYTQNNHFQTPLYRRVINKIKRVVTK